MTGLLVRRVGAPKPLCLSRIFLHVSLFFSNAVYIVCILYVLRVFIGYVWVAWSIWIAIIAICYVAMCGL